MWSLYVPNGRTPADPHFAYKLAWLDTLRATAAAELTTGTPLVLLGDFNIAPTDADVWDRPPSRARPTSPPRSGPGSQALEERGWSRSCRGRMKYDTKYTYWDYRAGDFPRTTACASTWSTARRRSPARSTDAYVDREARKPGKTPRAGPKPVRPSDHTPVVVDVAL